MVTRSNEPLEQRRLFTRLRKLLLRSEGIVHGSLVRMERTCGGKNCRCTRGEKHVSLYLSVWEGGRTHMVYIPKAWEERVREWVTRDKELREVLLELSRLSVKRLREREG